MVAFHLDPLRDPRWREFLERQPQASVFHTPEWLRALERTYGYKPAVVTTEAPGQELRNAIVYCHVPSWLTGRRLVSVPFADHCQPLVESPEYFPSLTAALREELRRVKGRYFELRPLQACAELQTSEEFGRSAEYNFHRRDLRPAVDSLFRGFHKNCVQRKIRRAERESLSYQKGNSEALLAAFYTLLRMTRRRHLLPPPPLGWFRNLLNCLGGLAQIHVASHGGKPVASLFTLHYKQTLVYKYGGSDVRFHRLGGMPFLFWQALQEGKRLGAQEFDLGRSDRRALGQAVFKEHLGGVRSSLSYFRYPPRLSVQPLTRGDLGWARRSCGWLPDPLLTLAGRLLYKHVG